MAGAVVNIGRVRGEFERATKALVTAHSGSRHPRDLGFWHIDEARRGIAAACALVNGMAKEGRLQKGVPDERWHAAIKADPLRPLPKDKLWVFMPDEGTVQLRGGHARIKRGDQYLNFCEPEVFASLGNGYKVAVKFDAADAAAGAWIFNAEDPQATRNTERRALGAYICWAPLALDCPQFDASHGYDSTPRKKYTGAVRSAYQSLGLFGRGKHASEARDGAGTVTRVESTPRMHAPVVPVEQPIARISSVTTAPAQAAQNRCKAPAQPLQVEDFTLATTPRSAAQVPAPFVEDW